MGFPIDLACSLTGASPDQLSYWRTGDPPLLQPEVSRRPVEYSFRDLIALRTFVKLRKDGSLQAIRSAFSTLKSFDLTDHPSTYKLVRHGKSIVLVDEDEAFDLVRSPGNRVMATVQDIFEEFENRAGRRVVNFRHPRPNLEIRERRIGGWPTASGTRVPYDAIADLMATGEVQASEVDNFYPSVTPAAALDSVDFALEVREIASAATRSA